jgi:hypothetical protein
MIKKKKKLKESQLQTAILKELQSQGKFCWRQNNAPIYDPKIGGYRSQTGINGLPDIICVIDGIFTGIEVKSGTKQSADQILFQRRLELNGGKYILAQSVADIKDI